MRIREAAVRLVQRKDAAAEEQEERDDERPEVALLPVTKWMPLAGGPDTPADADVEEDLVQRVRDGVRGLRQERAGPGLAGRDALGDGDRGIAGERGEDRAC